MKKLSTILLAVILALTLCACESQENSNIYTAEQDGKLFTVNTEDFTVSDGVNTYNFSVTGSGSGYELRITYPNGAEWWYKELGNGGGAFGGYSDDYNERTYVSGYTLKSVIESETRNKESRANVIPGLLVMAIGIFNVAAPRKAWYLSKGWRYKNLEPSDASLVVNCIIGVFVTIVGLVLCFTL